MLFSELSIWMIALCAGGVFLASFMDSIAGGGGLISLPIYMMAGLPPHQATATNKLSSTTGTVISTLRYMKNGFCNLRQVLPATVFSIVGGILGMRLQFLVPAEVLKMVLLVLLPAVAFIVLKQKTFPEEPGDIEPGKQLRIVCAAALIIGIYDGFYGPGTGTFAILAYCRFAKMDIRTASGNAKIINLCSNFSALITALIRGNVLVPLGLICGVFSIAGHYIGSGLAIKNGSKIIRPMVIAVLVFFILKILSEIL